MYEPQIADRRDERDVLEAHALAEKTHQRERDESRQQREIERLRAEQLPQVSDPPTYLVTSAGSSCLAIMRELSRIARVGAADRDRCARHGVDVAADAERIANASCL